MSEMRRDLNPGVLHVKDTFSRCFRRLLTTFQTAADFGPKSGFFDFSRFWARKSLKGKPFSDGFENFRVFKARLRFCLSSSTTRVKITNEAVLRPA